MVPSLAWRTALKRAKKVPNDSVKADAAGCAVLRMTAARSDASAWHGGRAAHLPLAQRCHVVLNMHEWLVLI
jgi:hypothetical protein